MRYWYATTRAAARADVSDCQVRDAEWDEGELTKDKIDPEQVHHDSLKARGGELLRDDAEGSGVH